MIAIATLTGTEKEMSEDAVLAGNDIVINANKLLDIPARGFICVADGVGGNNAGEIASSFVLEALRSYDGSQDIKSFLRDFNHKLLEKSRERADYNQMATTLTGVWINNEAASFLVHVGNTRAYLLQGRYLKQITEDHTLYGFLYASGRKEEAENCNKAAITNCFGGGDERLLERLTVIPLCDYHCILLTSDGVHEHVDLDTMELVVNGDLPDIEKCNYILKKAQEYGSTDDLSVVIIRC